MSKRKTITGWIGKSRGKKLSKGGIGKFMQIGNVYLKKQDKWFWLKADWPPRKVRITIEEV